MSNNKDNDDDTRVKVNFYVLQTLLTKFDALKSVFPFASRTDLLIQAMTEFLQKHAPKKKGKK